MITLEDQIRLVADAAVAQEPRTVLRRDTDVRPRTPRSFALAAAAALAIALVAALFWAVRPGPESPTGPTPTAPPTDPVTLRYPTGDWLLPTWLPDDLTFDRAQRGGDGLADAVVYRGEGRRQLTMSAGDSLADGLTPSGSVEIDGTTWSLLVQAERPDMITLYRHDATGDVMLDGLGLTQAELTSVAGGLVAQPATALPRPPLPVVASAGIEVARAGGAALRADSDGVYLSLAITTTWGQSGSGAALQLDGRVLAIANVISGPEGTFVAGVVRADVAVVELTVRDGSTIRTTPQDLSGRFVERFVLVELPGGYTESTKVSVVAYAADGTELARQDDLFS